MSLNDSDFGSDTDDDDYVPTGEGHDASEEENSGEEENPETGSKNGPKKKKKTKTAPLAVNARTSMFDDGEKVDWTKELAEEKKELNEEKAKKKVDDLWADFKKDTSVKPAPSKPKSGGSSLASLFGGSVTPAQSTSIQPEKKPSSRLASLFDDIAKPSETKEPTKQKPKSLLSGLFDDEPKNEVEEDDTKSSSKASELTGSDNKIEITKVYDFAGEVVKVSKQVSADSSEAQKFLKSQEATASPSSGQVKRPGGLAGIVGSIGKKAKMGCLDKSKIDWNSFVDESGIKDELKTFNKGKEGYVEKQMFLERADLRQFEQEKALRDKNRKALMK
eukprot:TRINITY_DN74932_c0_g1_i1.p1 TRINITY_DN74932_c0_g1~~TRINITY_DN74932_c0_g1_i1.p1  ORF type:complete len:333 (+),score=137.37 TRINITY_DN74932_c0_g1_i1:33-1031(+)